MSIRHRMSCICLVVLVAYPTPVAVGQLADWYVDGTEGDDENAGTSWNQAFATFQKALEFAGSEDPVIWVAEGTYNPPSFDEPYLITMDDQLEIYGGFPAGGGNGTFGARDPDLYPTILSGEIDDPGVADNVLHVLVFAEGSTPEINPENRLDGFTVTRGNADGSPWPTIPDDGGGGVLIYDPDLDNDDDGVLGPTINNCIFHDNRANTFGGAVAAPVVGAILTNCTFTENMALSGGNPPLPVLTGGGAVSVAGELHVVSCKFVDNTSYASGGALELLNYLPEDSENDVKIVNCDFRGNKASHDGGGGYVDYGDGYVVNCLFAHNEALGEDGIKGGGGLEATGLSVFSCTFVNNKAWDDSGAENAEGGGATLGGDIRNCLFRGNFADNDVVDWHTQQLAEIDCPTFCNIEGWFCECTGDGCEGTLDMGVTFVDPEGLDSDPDTRSAPRPSATPCVTS